MKKNRFSPFEKLKRRIKKDIDLDLFDFERCYAGYWQRSNGAWSWRAKCLLDNNIVSPRDYGSCYSATDLLKEKSSLTILHTEIMPST